MSRRPERSRKSQQRTRIATLAARLLTEDGIASAGDLLSGAGGPHAQRSYAEDWAVLADSLQRVQQMAPEVVYAGHGRTAIPAAAFEKLSSFLPGATPQEP